MAIQAAGQVVGAHRNGGDHEAPTSEQPAAPREAKATARETRSPRPKAPRRDPRRQPVNGHEPPVEEPRAPEAAAAPEPPPNVVEFDNPGPLSADAGHVSEESTLVEERADAGAEEGAGAQIRVDEPWPGYGRMKAPEVLARVESATPAELTAMRLYEGLHRRREKVLGAIDKRLESTSTSD